MTKIKALFRNAKVRLAARAIVAAGIYAFTHLHGKHVDRTVLYTVAVGAGWVALEYVTPINNILGLFKQAEKVDPGLKAVAPPADLPKPPAAA